MLRKLMGKHLIKKGLRKCYWCKHIFPLSKKFFFGSRRESAGLQYLCRKCKNKETRKWWRKHPEKKHHPNGKYLYFKKTAEKKLGRKLEPNEVIHHIDGNKKNNSPRNLYVFRSHSIHINYEQNLRTTYLKWVRSEINNLKISI